MSLGPLLHHGDALWRPLSQAGLAVAAERSVARVLEVAGQQLNRLGIRLSVLRLRSDEVFLVHNAPDASTTLGAKLKQPTALSLESQRAVRLALSLRQGHFVEDPVTVAVKAAQELGLPSDSLAAQVRAAGLTSMVVSPLHVGAEPWGAALYGGEDVRHDDMGPLHHFSGILEAALVVAETLATVERKNRELEAVRFLSALPVESASAHPMLEAVAKGTHADAAVLHRYDAERDEFVMVGDAYGYGGPEVEKFRRFKLGDRAPGAGALAEAGFPELATVILTLDGRQRGLLSLGRRELRLFTAQELETAELLGAQVTQVLERVRLQAEAQRRLRQLSLLYELAAAGAVTGQANSVLERVLGQMLEAFPADIVAIHFAEGAQFRLAGWRMRDIPGVPNQAPTPEHIGYDQPTVIADVARGRKAMRVKRADFPRFTAEAAERLQMKHMLAAPLLVRDVLVGTLAVVRCSDESFTGEEQQLAESCGGHIAVILEHLRLFEDLRQSYEQLERAQAEVVRHERLAALGELAAVMAHEVRNPLGVIFNALTGLKRLLGKSQPDAAMLLDIVGEEADRLNRIVGDLLDFARPYEAVRKAVPLESVVASAVDAASASSNHPLVKVVTELPGVLPRFFVDAHLLRQAVVNLVMNAMQAMPKGGTVTVRVEREQRGTEVWARIDVRDEGVGISAQSAERIFQPFFTTKATGTGLGLAVVKRIIDAHHGEVFVRPAPEGGSVFTVRVPGGET